jgi:hypothetical protein
MLYPGKIAAQQIGQVDEQVKDKGQRNTGMKQAGDGPGFIDRALGEESPGAYKEPFRQVIQIQASLPAPDNLEHAPKANKGQVSAGQYKEDKDDFFNQGEHLCCSFEDSWMVGSLDGWLVIYPTIQQTNHFHSWCLPIGTEVAGLSFTSICGFILYYPGVWATQSQKP